jgi:predicted kinase
MTNQTTSKLNTHMPLLIVVSGAPGTGKTTLAAKIAQGMHLLHLERDTFFRSLEHAAGGQQIDRPNAGIPLFYKVVSDLLRQGVSLVIDSTLYRDTYEENIAPLQKLADVVNVHCRANSADQRFYERELERAGGRTPDWLENHMSHLKKIKPIVEYPLQIGWDILEVDTNGEYKPTVKEVVAKLQKRQPLVRSTKA